MFRLTKATFILLSACLVTACNGSNPSDKLAVNNSSTQYVNAEHGYSIEAPNSFEIGKHAKLDVIQGPGLYAQNGTNVDIYDPSSPNAPPNCSASITGTSQPMSLNGTSGMTTWGKVSVWDYLNFESGDNPYVGLEKVICKKDGTPPPASVYALCSEKDGKTVVICISQMTDNPQLAEEIFRTFKWTKE